MPLRTRQRRSAAAPAWFADQWPRLAAIRAEGSAGVADADPGGLDAAAAASAGPPLEALLVRTMNIDPEARSSMWELSAARPPPKIDYLQGVITEIRRPARLQAPCPSPPRGR